MQTPDAEVSLTARMHYPCAELLAGFPLAATCHCRISRESKKNDLNGLNKTINDLK